MVKRLNINHAALDLAGLAIFAAVSLAGYGLLLHRPLRDSIDQDLVRRQREETLTMVSELQHSCTVQYRHLEQKQDSLEQQARWLNQSRGTEEVLSRIDELARQCDVEIIRWQPMGQKETEAYRMHAFSIEGVASYAAVYRWFALVENGVPLLDLSHFSMEASPGDPEKKPRFRCSLKLYSGASAALSGGLAAAH